jgi:hypothetical protein
MSGLPVPPYRNGGGPAFRMTGWFFGAESVEQKRFGSARRNDAREFAAARGHLRSERSDKRLAKLVRCAEMLAHRFFTAGRNGSGPTFRMTRWFLVRALLTAPNRGDAIQFPALPLPRVCSTRRGYGIELEDDGTRRISTLWLCSKSGPTSSTSNRFHSFRNCSITAVL